MWEILGSLLKLFPSKFKSLSDLKYSISLAISSKLVMFLLMIKVNIFKIPTGLTSLKTQCLALVSIFFEAFHLFTDFWYSHLNIDWILKMSLNLHYFDYFCFSFFFFKLISNFLTVPNLQISNHIPNFDESQSQCFAFLFPIFYFILYL
jgi:hypothetical protein